jgi:hypothetical protein
VGYSFEFLDPAKFWGFQTGKAMTPGMHESCERVDPTTGIGPANYATNVAAINSAR